MRKIILLGLFILAQFLAPDTRAYNTGHETWHSKSFGTAQNITWCYRNIGKDYLNRNITPVSAIFPKGYDKEIRRAFNEWEQISNISFTYKAGTRCTGDIRISAHRQDGSIKKDNSLAIAFFPGHFSKKDKNYEFNGDIFFDRDEDWTSLGVFGVALHEIGHTIGIDHSDSKDSVMHSIYNPNLLSPQFDDIRAAQKIYGGDKTIGYAAVIKKKINDNSNKYLYLFMGGVMGFVLFLSLIFIKRFTTK